MGYGSKIWGHRLRDHTSEICSCEKGILLLCILLPGFNILLTSVLDSIVETKIRRLDGGTTNWLVLWMYHALSVPSTYCQPKMPFQQLAHPPSISSPSPPSPFVYPLIQAPWAVWVRDQWWLTELKLQACLDGWNGCGSVGYLKYLEKFHTQQDLLWPNMIGNQPLLIMGVEVPSMDSIVSFPSVACTQISSPWKQVKTAQLAY